MSHNRELKIAQRDVNEAVEVLVKTGRYRLSSEPHDWQDAYDGLVNAWDAFETLRSSLEGDAAASARDTSIAAAKGNLPSIATLRGQVCERVFVAGLLKWRGPEFYGGMTCDELERALHRSHQSVSSAVNYAETAGWIRDSGFRRLTRSGSKAIVFTPSGKLIEACAERRRAG